MGVATPTARANLPTMSADDHKQALPPGFTLGSYRIERVLGVGGFGVTYLCEHGGLGVQVAVKEYLPIEVAVRDGTEVHPKSAGDREGFEWGLERFFWTRRAPSPASGIPTWCVCGTALRPTAPPTSSWTTKMASRWTPC